MDRIIEALAALARGAEHPPPSPCVPGPRNAGAEPAGPCPCGAPDQVLADRPDATVVRHGGTVAKAHAPGTDLTDLVPRLLAAAPSRPAGPLLPPAGDGPLVAGGRAVTLWPFGEPVDPEDRDAAPWADLGALLARLHRTPLPTGAGVLPPMRGPSRAAHAVRTLRTEDAEPVARDVVLAAWAALPAWARDEAAQPRALLCHGDVHLGQLVRRPEGPWQLIDIDDLGVGEPAWDLARPAAWFACGLLDPEEFASFLGAYRAGGGPAVPAAGDPWQVLDVPARALTVQSAARALTKARAAGAELDEVGRALVDCCRRIAEAPVPVSVHSGDEPAAGAK